jgi:eukaryotic-like serine/threonine-protein kinase
MPASSPPRKLTARRPSAPAQRRPTLIGQTLAHYRITAAIGAGGMGEVYRATDTKLGREVAIKVLPAELARDPERLSRFEREAKLLASLNHPNIAHVYGFESGIPPGGPAVHFLAMELVPGEDLAERLKRGKVPVDEAIAIAKQVAEGLEEAHERGIVHRDLKPANVKVTPDGKVKVLDFGLAKAWGAEASGVASSADLSQSPTLAHTGTAAGLILGTAAYMSPEQARGRTVDKRSDVWAFGVVLFEMLTGRRLFEGETVSDVLASVLKSEPEWAALPAATPPRLRHLLARCLERDPKRRLRDIGEARLALEAPLDDPEPTGRQAEARPGARRPGTGVALLAGGLLGGMALGGLLWRDGPGPRPERPPRTVLLPAPGRTLHDGQAISPDGQWLAFTAGGALWIRNLAELEPREVPDSKGASRPFWSPRSDAVAFASGGALFKVSRDGGRPQKLCAIPRGSFTGGSWSASGVIVFTAAPANWNGEVLRVPEDGGEPETLTRVDAAKGERRLYDPHFLPDGRTLLYAVVTFDDDGEIVVDRDGSRTRLGLGAASGPTWSPTGHVVFTRRSGSEESLWAVRFSLGSLATTGEAFRVMASGADASVAKDGTLVCARRRPEPQQLAWIDRQGKLEAGIGEARQRELNYPSISPDGRRVAAGVADTTVAWDAERGVETQVTADAERTLHAQWLPGGEEIAYSRASGEQGLWVRRADGTGEPRLLLARRAAAAPGFSPDGKHLAFYVLDPETNRDLWASAVDKPEEAFPLLRTKANEAFPRISPDGTLVAYQSDASGRWEVYVQPFPRGEGRWQVSVGGGRHASWNPRGGELFFVSGNDLMVVDVSLEPRFRSGTPRRLFAGDAVGLNLVATERGLIERLYDVAPDGRRFVVVRGLGRGTSDLVLADGVVARAGRAAEPGGAR